MHRVTQEPSQYIPQMPRCAWLAQVVILFVALLIADAYGHVALTFPRARKYDLDFLDNARTPGPCGMPRGDVKTSLLAGSKFNVSWHLAYPHRGGFRLQILDALDRPLVDLTPVTQQSEFVNEDSTAQYYPVELPQNFTCTDCTVRLLREAEEWGSNYRFWSCADIDIVDKRQYREDCSGHGRYVVGRCRCDRLYHGSRCEMREECLDDSDCGTQGVCVDNGGTTTPTKHCYCNFGFFGAGCSKRSPLKTVDIDLAGYTVRKFSDDFTFYWRILKESRELEGIMVVNGTSWVGVGWRPSSLTAACRAFPKIGATSDPEPLPEPEPKAEPAPEPRQSTEPASEPAKSAAKRRSAKISADSSVTPRVESDVTVQTSVTYRVSTRQGRKRRSEESANGAGGPTSLPEPTSEPEPKSEPVSTKPQASPEPISSPEPSSEPASSSKLASNLEPKAEPTAELASEPEPRSEPTAEPASVPEPSAEPTTGPESKVEPTSEPHSTLSDANKVTSKSEASPEPTPEYPKPEPKPEPTSAETEPSTRSGTIEGSAHKYTPKHDFNPMDCTDIIIGMARGNTYKIGDYYTRDRSTPRQDAFWGGKDSLTAAMGYETNGVTTIAFRRKLSANEPTDHEIIDGDMQVIWAKGQETGKYIHQPASGLEKSKVSVHDFYKPDELKYHGHRLQRGVATLNFFDEKNRNNSGGYTSLDDGTCGGEWKYPRNCVVKNLTCEYYVRWTYKTKKDQMTFTIMTNNTDSWTGIGFSDDDRMSQTDAVLGWVDKTNGRPFVMDTWINGYSAPVLDASQDIYNASGSIKDGMTTLTFSRKRATKDARDFSFTDESCVYMMFPVKGGIFNAVNKKIRKHVTIPIVSADRICIKSCGPEFDEEISSTPPSSKLSYDVQVKLVKLPDSFKSPQPGTVEFDDIAKTILDSFEPVLSGKLPCYSAMKINELDKQEDGAVVKMQVILDRDEMKGRALRPNDTIAITERIFKETLATGRVGSLAVDPNYFFVNSLAAEKAFDESDDMSDSNYGLLGETKLYIVVGCIAALIALALLQATCTLYRATRKRITKQERLIANNAWRDYSTGAKTNFAFEAFETEEKAPPPPISSLPRSRDSLDGIPRAGAVSSPVDKHRFARHQQLSPTARATYSLPRAPGPRQPSPPPQIGYYTQDRRNQRSKSHTNGNSTSSAQQPDFYFMPSQRKYSGEVVRVYVDYGNQKSK